jgi:hypothetical protein
VLRANALKLGHHRALADVYQVDAGGSWDYRAERVRKTTFPNVVSFGLSRRRSSSSITVGGRKAHAIADLGLARPSDRLFSQLARNVEATSPPGTDMASVDDVRGGSAKRPARVGHEPRVRGAGSRSRGS